MTCNRERLLESIVMVLLVKGEGKVDIELWKLVAKHVVQLAVLERVTGCRYTKDSQICVLREQCSSGPIGHVISQQVHKMPHSSTPFP